MQQEPTTNCRSVKFRQHLQRAGGMLSNGCKLNFSPYSQGPTIADLCPDMAELVYQSGQTLSYIYYCIRANCTWCSTKAKPMFVLAFYYYSFMRLLCRTQNFVVVNFIQSQ